MFSEGARQARVLFLIASLIAGCGSAQTATSISESVPILPTNSIASTPTAQQPSPTYDSSKYAFPESIDPTKQYLFYLHGKIIEDQGIPAVSPDFGEYEYQAILEKISDYGFTVISEQRAENTVSTLYAQGVSKQIRILLNAGVPANHITVVGASKGAGIAILTSYFLENEELNFVIMAICEPGTVKEIKLAEISLYGNVLSIYDSADEYAGSCQELFSFSEGKGISRYNEIVLNIGTGHGILYKPLDEWITPVVQWAGKP